MMWWSHTKEVLNLLIDIAKILSKEVDDATLLERPDRSFVASFDNVLAMSIMTFRTSFV